MIIGTVNVYLEAVIRLTVHGPQANVQDLDAMIDTGYTGFLTLPPPLIKALSLPFRRRGRAILADGSETLFDVHEANIAWDGQLRRIAGDALAANPLIGMALLDGHKLTIQAVRGGHVYIERAAD